MNKHTTLVTALYDIERDKWQHHTMSYNTYLHWMKNTLAIDCNMVIFTEEKFKEEIIRSRREVDPTGCKTHLLITPLKELDAYVQFNDELEELMSSEAFKKQVSFHHVPEMSKPLYNVVMFNKVRFLEIAAEAAAFPGQQFLFWVDAGGLREDIKNYKGVVWPNEAKIDKERITFFSHHSDISIQVPRDHALSQMRFIQGTAFIVPIEMIDSMVTTFNMIVEACIANGYIGSDEKILDFLYLSDPRQCKLIKCDWREYFNLLK